MPCPPRTTLREQVQSILAEGQEHSRQAGQHRQVVTCWHVGDAIQVHAQDRASGAAYGQQIISNLSKDKGLPESALDDIVRFRRASTILSTSINGYRQPHRNGTLGMEIDPAFRGRGCGADALALTLRFAFHELNLHRMSLTGASYNDIAIKLYESAGFVREGVTREGLHRDGHVHDILHYGLLNREWSRAARTCVA